MNYTSTIISYSIAQQLALKAISACMLLVFCFLSYPTLAQTVPTNRELVGATFEEIKASQIMIDLDQRYYKQAQGTLRFMIQAQLAYYKRDLAGALEFINESLKLFETTEGYALKGSLQYLRGNRLGAQKSWEKATEFSPDFLIPDTDILDQIIKTELQN